MQAFRSASELIELALHFLDIAVGILPGELFRRFVRGFTG
jgi:hypothetical protein